MGCKECGKPKCNGKCGCKSPKVLQINNPAEYITFHKVSIPAAMGDSTTNPPRIGAYRNALVYYEADHTSWVYSTDGIPTLVTGEKGETGDVGPQGPAGTITVGTTTTGEAGSDAEVENVGTPENAILNFTIPKGDKGDQGVPGPQGYMNEQDVRDVVDTIVPEGFFDDEATVSGCGTEFELENLAGGEPVSVRINGDTFQQSYAGKNLCGGTLAQLKNRNPSGTWNGNQYFQSGITWTVYENADGTIDRIEASGQATENGKTFYIESFNRQQFEEQLGSEETYTLSGCPQGGSSGYYVRVASIPWKSILTDRGSGATGTLIPSDNYNSVFVILGIDTSAGQVNNLVFRPQLELGSTATSFEPYVGGIPSPNPDYPQPIQTVTGTQTIAINGTNYPLDLGNIELHKLGTYQDRIYQDGDDWKIEKQFLQRTFNGNDTDIIATGWFSSSETTATTQVCALKITTLGASFAGREYSKMTHFILQNTGAVQDGIFRLVNNSAGATEHVRIALSKTIAADLTAGKAWIAAHLPKLVTPLLNPTTTTITDAALIAQLEAIRLDAGVNAISISSDSLSGEICLEAYRDNWEGTIADIDSRIEENYNLISDIKSAKWGLLGISREGTSGSNYHLVYSPDGEKFYHCAKMPAGIGTDASSLTEINGKFYYFGSNRYSFTEDFVNWTPMKYINTNYGGGQWRLWANTAYYDEDNEILYIYGAYQYSDDTFITPSGNTDYYFKIGYQTAIVNPDGTLVIDSTVHDLLYNDGESYIDPFVAKDPYMGYLLAYKNEVTRKVRVRQMTSLTSVGSSEIENPADGIEAPQLVTTSFGTICYVDGYALGKPAKTDISGIPGMSAYFLVSYEGSFMNSNNPMGLMPIYAPFELRHLGVMQCSKNAFYLAQQLGIETQIPSVCSNYGILNGLRNISVSSSTSPVLVNFPFALYSVPSSKTLTIRTDFKTEPIRLYVRKGITITWSNDSTIQSSCKGETYTPPTDQILTLYPDARDNLGGMWVPIDRA